MRIAIKKEGKKLFVQEEKEEREENKKGKEQNAKRDGVRNIRNDTRKACC